jgi:2-methylisocitrate lyase-like PEP mutase family enzyme
MNDTTAAKRAAFRELHAAGCFVIPNPWDRGSARYLQTLGFKALATTSAGYAWSLGRPDNGVSRDEVIGHLRDIVSVSDVPVSADYEHGFADAPEGVATNVVLALATGIAGLSVEDSTGRADQPLYEFPLAVERIKAARAAFDAAGAQAVLTARAECYLVGRPDIREVVKRLTAYAEAGADCLYAPGLRSKDDIQAVVRAVAPKPVNVLVGTGVFSVADLAGLGVRRISVGGTLARVAWSAFMQAASDIAKHGSFAHFAQGVPFADLNGVLKADHEQRKPKRP